MATAGGIVVLHPAGTGGGDIQQLVVVGVVQIHSAAWQYTQVCDLLEFLLPVGDVVVLLPAVAGVLVLHPAGTGGGDVQHSVVVGSVLVLHHNKDLSSTSSHTPW